jgi:type IV secretory pathway TrbL component
MTMLMCSITMMMMMMMIILLLLLHHFMIIMMRGPLTHLHLGHGEGRGAGEEGVARHAGGRAVRAAHVRAAVAARVRAGGGTTSRIVSRYTIRLPSSPGWECLVGIDCERTPPQSEGCNAVHYHNYKRKGREKAMIKSDPRRPCDCTDLA